MLKGLTATGWVALGSSAERVNKTRGPFFFFFFTAYFSERPSNSFLLDAVSVEQCFQLWLFFFVPSTLVCGFYLEKHASTLYSMFTFPLTHFLLMKLHSIFIYIYGRVFFSSTF